MIYIQFDITNDIVTKRKHHLSSGYDDSLPRVRSRPVFDSPMMHLFASIKDPRGVCSYLKWRNLCPSFSQFIPLVSPYLPHGWDVGLTHVAAHLPGGCRAADNAGCNRVRISPQTDQRDFMGFQSSWWSTRITSLRWA